MKAWSQTQLRNGNTLAVADYNRDHEAARASAVSIDRTQLPATSINRAKVTAGAFHRVWLFDMEDVNADYPGEQSVERDTDGLSFQFAGISHYRGSTTEFFSGSCADGKEGMYQIELKGNYFVHKYWDFSARPINPKKLGIRIYWNSNPVLETWGFTHPMGSFTLNVTVPGVAGSNTLSMEYTCPESGSQDSRVVAGTSYHVTQAHLWGMQALVIGRWR